MLEVAKHCGFFFLSPVLGVTRDSTKVMLELSLCYFHSCFLSLHASVGVGCDGGCSQNYI